MAQDLENTSPLSNTSPTIEPPKKGMFGPIAPPKKGAVDLGKAYDTNVYVNTGFGKSKYDKELNWDAAINQAHIEDSINEFRANQQSGLTQLGAGVLRAGTKAAIEVAKLPGVIGGIAMSPFAEEGQGYDTAFNNSWIKALDKVGETINTEALPVYVKKAVKEGNLWDAITSTGFWATEGADGLGFMIGMMAPGAAINKLGLGAKLIGGTAKVAETMGMVGKTEEAVSALKTLGLTANKIDVGIGAVVNTMTESGAEAAGVGNDLDAKKDQIIANYSMPKFAQLDQMRRSGQINDDQYNQMSQQVSEEAEAKFTEQRALAMRDTFKANLGILIIPNLLMSKALFGKAGNKLVKEVEKTGIKGVGQRVGKAAMRYGEAFASEGFMEEAGQTTAQNLFTKKAERGELERGSNMLGGIFGGIKDFTIGEATQAYLDTVASNEGQKAVFLGGIMGAPMMSYQGRKEDLANYAATKEYDKTKNSILTGLHTNTANFNTIFENDIYKKNAQGGYEYVKDEFGNPTSQREVIPSKVIEVANALNLKEQESKIFEQAVNEGDEATVNAIKQKAIFDMVEPAIHNGEAGMDALEEKLKEYSKMEEVEASDADPNNKKKSAQAAKEILETAKWLQEQNEKFQDFAPDVIDFNDPNMTPEIKQAFLNNFNRAYLNTKFNQRNAQTKLANLKERRKALYEEAGIDPLYDPTSDMPMAKMKQGKEGLVTSESMEDRAMRAQRVHENNPMIKNVDQDIKEVEEFLDKTKKDIAEIWSAGSNKKIQAEAKKFTAQQQALVAQTSPAVVAQTQQVINTVKEATTKAELNQLLLMPHDPNKTFKTPEQQAQEDAERTEAADVEVEKQTKLAQNALISDIVKSITEDQSLPNLKNALAKLNSLDFTSPKVESIIKRIEERIEDLINERSEFEDSLLEAIDKLDQVVSKLNDELAKTEDDVNDLLKSKEELLKSIADKQSPRGRNAKLIKAFVADVQKQITVIDKKIEILNDHKSKLQEALKQTEKELDYIYTRYEQIGKTNFASIQDIIDYLNKNKERFKEHRKALEKLLINKHYTEQNIEGLNDVVDKLEHYKSVLEDIIKRFVVEGVVLRGTDPEELRHIREELKQVSKELFEVKQELKSEKAKLKRLDKSISDLRAREAIGDEVKFWEDIQKFKETKGSSVLRNPIVQQEIDNKLAELELKEQLEKEAEEARKRQEFEDNKDEDPEEDGTNEDEVVPPPAPLDPESESTQNPDDVETGVDEDGNPIPLKDEETPDEDQSELDEAQASAKIISTRRLSKEEREAGKDINLEGKALNQHLEPFVEYERDPRDKTKDEVTFSLGDINYNKESKEAGQFLEKLKRGEELTPAELISLENDLPIKVTLSNGKDKASSFIEALTKKNVEIYKADTLPLRKKIVKALIANKGSFEGITGEVEKQLPGALKIAPQNQDGTTAKNSILELNDFKNEADKIAHFQRNSAYVNFNGDLVSALNNEMITPGFGIQHKGRVFLKVKKANGEDFWMKLNISNINNEQGNAIFELMLLRFKASKGEAIPLSKIKEVVPASLKKEVDLMTKGLDLADVNLATVNKLIDLMIFNGNSNYRTQFGIYFKNSTIVGKGETYKGKTGVRVGTLFDKFFGGETKGQITAEQLLADPERYRTAFVEFFNHKRHNVLVKSTAFNFQKKEYVKYLLDNNILTTNAVVNEPTFQGHANIYLNQNVKVNGTTTSQAANVFGTHQGITPTTTVKPTTTVVTEVKEVVPEGEETLESLKNQLTATERLHKMGVKQDAKIAELQTKIAELEKTASKKEVVPLKTGEELVREVLGKQGRTFMQLSTEEQALYQSVSKDVTDKIRAELKGTSNVETKTYSGTITKEYLDKLEAEDSGKYDKAVDYLLDEGLIDAEILMEEDYNGAIANTVKDLANGIEQIEKNCK